MCFVYKQIGLLKIVKIALETVYFTKFGAIDIQLCYYSMPSKLSNICNFYCLKKIHICFFQAVTAKPIDKFSKKAVSFFLVIIFHIETIQNFSKNTLLLLYVCMFVT